MQRPKKQVNPAQVLVVVTVVVFISALWKWQPFGAEESYKDFASVPVISAQETGPRIVLIPLEEADFAVVNGIRENYEKITGIKTSIRRLGREWTWEREDRIASQPQIQQSIFQLIGRVAIDEQNAHRYGFIGELRQFIAQEKDPQRLQYAQQLMDYIEKAPPQYNASKYTDKLREEVHMSSKGDDKTIFVAVTSKDIYSKQYNFIYSLSKTKNMAKVALISYVRFYEPAKENWEQLLFSRLTKELMPITIADLGVAPSGQPGDVLAFANNLNDVDAKQLQLSDGQKQQLRALGLN